MTPPSCFYFGKIKTDVTCFPVYFVFLYLRPSSQGLHNTPSIILRNKIKQEVLTYAALFYTNHIICFYHLICQVIVC
ncbi:hypothetical protein F9279_16960 [Bacillus sp. B1-b2]|nr:hypothetical protein F9279_16960 [Bacillus sp. B1-b2]